MTNEILAKNHLTFTSQMENNQTQRSSCDCSLAVSVAYLIMQLKFSQLVPFCFFLVDTDFIILNYLFFKIRAEGTRKRLKEMNRSR